MKPIRSCLKHRLPLIRRDRPDQVVGKGVFAGSVPETAFDDLSAQDQYTASACGWTCVVNGEAGIRRALQILQAGLTPSGPHAASRSGELSGGCSTSSGLPSRAIRSAESSKSISPALSEADPQPRSGFALPPLPLIRLPIRPPSGGLFLWLRRKFRWSRIAWKMAKPRKRAIHELHEISELDVMARRELPLFQWFDIGPAKYSGPFDLAMRNFLSAVAS